MLAPRGTEKVRDRRRLRHRGPIRLHLAVEAAQRIVHHASAAILAETVPARLEIRKERSAIGGTARGVADGIEDQLRVVQPQPVQEYHEHLERLGVDGRMLAAEHLDTDLVDRKSTRLNSSH